MFHARWWDYSSKPMNLNGRVWIGNLILFGVASVVIVKWIDPTLFGVMTTWPEQLMVVLAVLIVFLLLTDCAISHVLMNIVKKEIDKRDEDNTEEISRKIHELLKNRGLLIRRINKAYPDLQARPKRLMLQLKERKAAFKQAKKETKIELQSRKKSAHDKQKETIERAKRKQTEARKKLRDIQNRLTIKRDD